MPRLTKRSLSVAQGKLLVGFATPCRYFQTSAQTPQYADQGMELAVSRLAQRDPAAVGPGLNGARFFSATAGLG